ncbi:hypothetical protein SAY86_031838 [Trapa natans]|uniref:YDG domain-containing protein n=1 Tax=Trapa natans TaxID=22666 RepID=A0AAN7M875_TRANT|nr:hypothetical protein SAY86_031838 [Trapa natans]
MESKYRRPKHAKYSFVVRDFPLGCGTRASEIIIHRGNGSTKSAAVKALLPERSPHHSAKRNTALVVRHTRAITSSFGGNSSPRVKVRDTINLFRALCKDISQGNMKARSSKEKIKRVDLKAWEFLKDLGADIYGGKLFIGVVPGVEIGDTFFYRIELNAVGLHRPPQNGIDFTKENGDIIAISVVASNDTDNMNSPDELIYVGQGGIARSGGVCRDCNEDQKLIRGNLAMCNSVGVKNPVRVIRTVGTSIYDRELVTHSKEICVRWPVRGRELLRRTWGKWSTHLQVQAQEAPRSAAYRPLPLMSEEQKCSMNKAGDNSTLLIAIAGLPVHSLSNSVCL